MYCEQHGVEISTSHMMGGIGISVVRCPATHLKYKGS